MKIAGVSMTYNDGYKIKEWRQHYLEYKQFLDVFVIVDNGSEKGYQELLKTTFPEAIIIYRKENGGCTAAYNEGIKYVLENSDADAIAIIANDIKVTSNCLPVMSEYLYSDKKLGIVSSAILNINSDIIDNYGHCVKNFKVSYCNRGELIKNIKVMKKYTDLVSGGFTMAKREFYLRAGVQDEALFMYCDEMDTMFKARKFGYKMGVIASEYAWHWHINSPSKGKRSSASRYLISRNRVYLAKKYTGLTLLFEQIIRGLILTPFIHGIRFLKYRDCHELKDALYSMVGVFHGLCGKMYTNKYTEF